MNKRSEETAQHVLETERIVIKDEVIDDDDGIIEPTLLDDIKDEPQDIIEFEETREFDSYSTICIETVESCKTEKEGDFTESAGEAE